MENNAFKFTYSTKEQEEVKKIRQKYTDTTEKNTEENKLEKLRKLDKSVTDKATIFSLFLGIVGALIMGTGMSLVMTDIGEKIGIENTMMIGIIIGIIGMGIAIIAYPVYNYIVKNERKKITPEILRLTDELMK